MPKRGIKVSVKPEVFIWLKESSGWTTDEIAKRLKISSKVVNEFESGDKPLKMSQIKTLAKAFKRPIAAFMFSKPLAEKNRPKDYRAITSRNNVFDKKTLLVMRETRRLQSILSELLSGEDYQNGGKLERRKIAENPEKIALEFRKKLDLTRDKQRRFRDGYGFFNYLRDAFEEMNVFVFQFSMPIEDARGFTFAEELPYTIVVNTKDSIEARIFTLMHEVGHILLRESAIGIPDAGRLSGNENEKWCDSFSAFFIVPEEYAKEEFGAHKGSLTTPNQLKRSSRKFKASKAMLLRRMKDMKYITKSEYDSKMNQYTPKSKEELKSSGIAIPQERKALSELGSGFVSLVAKNFNSQKITFADALDYLSIKANKFDKLLSKTRK